MNGNGVMTMNEKKSNPIGTMIKLFYLTAWIVQIVFVVLKLTGIVNWNWGAVALPLIIMMASLLLLSVVVWIVVNEGNGDD